MSTLSTALAHQHLSLPRLCAESEAVILFGSRAAGLGQDDSDWDLLVVGEGRSELTRELDLIWIAPARFRQISWLESELAGHIGAWGRTLAGAHSWLDELRGARTGAAALAHKRRQLGAQLGACERYWTTMTPWGQETRSRRIRRDLQRHARLVQRIAPPPSPTLDHEWQELDERERARCSSSWLRAANLGERRGPWLDS